MIHTEEDYEFLRIEVIYDEDPLNPRDDWEPATTIAYASTRYDLGDRKVGDDEVDAYMDGGWDSLVELVKEQEGAVAVLPISMMDHSGVSIWIGEGPSAFDTAGWDSGFAGFVYITQSQIDTYGIPDADKCMRGEVEEFNNYLTGNVFGFTIATKDGEVHESVWGFNGDPDYCLEEARRTAEYVAKRITAEALAKFM